MEGHIYRHETGSHSQGIKGFQSLKGTEIKVEYVLNVYQGMHWKSVDSVTCV